MRSNHVRAESIDRSAKRLETRGQALSHKKKGPDPKALTMVGRERHASLLFRLWL